MRQRMDKKSKEIGKRIAEARHEAGGMTQEELAALIGVSPRSVQAYELGEVIPYRQLRDLEQKLGKPVAWFLHGEEAMQARDDQLELILRKLEAVERELAALRSSMDGSGARTTARRTKGAKQR